MEQKEHSKHCACGHEHDCRSNPVKRWIVTFIIVTGILIILRPFIAQQMLARAASYFTCSSYDEAIRICKKTVMIDKKNVRAWTSLGYAYKEKGELDNAIEAYKKVYDLNPDDKGSSFDLAMAYYLKNEYGKAVPYLERLRMEGPDKNKSLKVDILNYHRSALTMLKECYQQLGDNAKVESIKSEIKKYYPDSHSAARRIGLYEK